MPDFFQQTFGDETESSIRKTSRKPWWLRTTKASHGFLMAGAYFGIAVVALIVSFFAAPIVARMFAALWLVFSVWYLISATVARRKQRRPLKTMTDA
jgi:branched-subunit amino acid ABC-type transport system permease component